MTKRDNRFAELCLKELAEGAETVVCIVGLVHVDGIVDRIKNPATDAMTL